MLYFYSHSRANSAIRSNPSSQYATIAALEGGDEAMNQMLKAFGSRREKMLEKLDGMKELGLDYVKPDGVEWL